ncbi:MAG: DUF2490 domain-containing protein [Bacteroidetes bacterium]|nr:DUF2490 domain-containing protein [Bacteroidota bacterium]
MNKLFKFIIAITVLYFCASPATAQVLDEWEARPNIAIKYKFNKKLSLAGTYYLYLDKNISRYNKSVIGAELDYKFCSWLKAGIDYRYGIDPKENYHDIRYSATIDFKISKKWKMAYRPMLQQEFISLQKVKLSTDPVKYYLRNRITASFKVSTATEIYVFTENYLKPQSGSFYFHRQKSALGAEFDVSNRSKLGVRFEVLHKKSGKVVARPNISYAITLGKFNKKA